MGTTLLVFTALLATAQAGTLSGRHHPESSLDQVISKEQRQTIDARKAQNEMRFGEQAVPDFSDVPSLVDLRNRDRAVTDQGSKPWCTIYGLVSTMENILGDGTDISERDGWDNQNGIQNVSASQKYNGKYGVVTEAAWPMGYWPGWNKYCSEKSYTPKNIKFIDDDVNAAVHHLAQGLPVYIGMSTPNSLYRCDTNVDITKGTTGGGHAFALIGYKIDPGLPGGGAFLVKNSYGTDCGDKGYQWMPFGACARSGFYCSMYTIGGVETSSQSYWCSR